MKRFAIASTAAVFFLTVSTMAWAKEAKAPGFAAFLHQWAGSKLHQQQEGGVKARLLQRYVTPFEGKPFSIGTILSFTFPKNTPFDRKAVAENIRKAMGFKAWATIRKQKNASVYEGEWTAGNRYLRIYIWDDKDSYSYSMATFRPAYAASFAIESEMLQRHLAGVAEPAAPWMQRWLDRVAEGKTASPFDETAGWLPRWPELPELPELPGLFASAWAQDSGCNTACAPYDTPCQMQAASCSMAQMSNQMSTLNNTLGGINQNLGNANTNWANTNDRLGAANTNWANTNTQLGNANTNWGNTNAQLGQFNQNWSRTNDEFHRTNDMLEKMIQPGNAFLFAAATAAGAATGALVVNLAVQGLSFLGSELLEAITHAKDDATRLKAFQDARQLWEKQSQAARELEATIDRLLDARQIAKGFGLTRAQLLSHLGTRGVQETIARDDSMTKATEAFKAGDMVNYCSYSEKVSNLNDVIAEVGSLRDRLKTMDLDRDLCSSLTEKLRALRIVEGQLQDARMDILIGQQAFMDQRRKEFEARAKGLGRLKDPKDHASVSAQRKKLLKGAEDTRDRALEEIEKITDREMSACVREVDDGKVCKRMERDTRAEVARKIEKATAQRDAPGVSPSSKSYLSNYIGYLNRWMRWYETWLDTCREENSVNVGAQIPLIGPAFRGTKSVRNWCTNYLNAQPLYQSLATRKIEAKKAYDSAVVSAEREYRTAMGLEDYVTAHNPTFENEIRSWNEWFNMVRMEQACLVEDAVCDSVAKEKAVLSRYRRLQTKAGKIEQVCAQTRLE